MTLKSSPTGKHAHIVRDFAALEFQTNRCLKQMLWVSLIVLRDVRLGMVSTGAAMLICNVLCCCHLG